MDQPNKVVKIVFEQVGEIDDADSVIGLKVFLEMPDRKITDEVLESEDRTASEVWASEIFELVTHLLHEKADSCNDLDVYEPSKKGELS